MWGRFPIWLTFFKLGWNHQLDIQSSSHNSRYIKIPDTVLFFFRNPPWPANHRLDVFQVFFLMAINCRALNWWVGRNFWTSTTWRAHPPESLLESRQRTTVPLATLVTTSPAQAARSIWGLGVFWGEGFFFFLSSGKLAEEKVGRWFLMFFFR